MKKHFALLLAILLAYMTMSHCFAEDMDLQSSENNPMEDASIEFTQAEQTTDSVEEAPEETGTYLLIDDLPEEQILATVDGITPDATADSVGNQGDIVEENSMPDPTTNATGLTLTLVSDSSKSLGDSIQDRYLGHSFLVIRNDSKKKAFIGNYVLKPGEQATLGLRGADREYSFKGFPYDGAYINYETLYMSGEGSFSNFSYITIDIDQEKLNIIAEYFRRNSYYHFLEHNCAWAASGAWNKVCPSFLTVLQDYLPVDLQFQIDLLPGSKKGTSLNKGLLDPVSDKKRIFYMDKSATLWPLGIGEAIDESTKSVETTATKATIHWKAAKGVENKHTASKRKYGEGYLVLYKKVNSDSYKEKYIENLTSNTCTLTELSPGTDYHIAVLPAYKMSTPAGPFYPYGTGFALDFTTNDVSLKKKKLSLTPGQSATLVPTTKGTTTYPLFWGTTNTKVATVDAKGKVTAQGIGKATISVSYGEETAKCKVTVTGIELSGYLWKSMSSVASRIGGLKKGSEVISGTKWYSYKGKGVELYTLNGYKAKTAIININKKSDYMLFNVRVGMTEKKMLSAVKEFKLIDSDKAKNQAEYWYNIKKGNYTTVFYVFVKAGKVIGLSYYMLAFD